MKRKKFLIMVAGGTGSRMGASQPKQFIRIGGKAILRIALEKFIEAFPDIRVITVLPQSHIAWWRQYCIDSNFLCPQTIVAGGITRFHSVANALAKVPDGAAVAVHDGVRPLISVGGIRRLFSLAETLPAVIPVVPCVDTMKVLRPSSSPGVLELVPDMEVDRSLLYAVQTPQIFHSELLKEAYRQPFSTCFTDDGSVVQGMKTPLSYVEGERFNLKITTPDDLLLAKALMIGEK